MHHAEQILAREARLHPVAVGRHRDRVGVVDVERADRRLLRLEQRLADEGHVDGARRAPFLARIQVRPLQRLVVDGEIARGRQQRAACRVAPGAGQRRQAGDVTHRHATAGAAVETVVEPDQRGPGRTAAFTIFARQVADDVGRQAGQRCGPFRRAAAHPLGELGEPGRVAGNVVVIEQVVGNQHLHHRQCERTVRSRPRRQMHVALRRGFRAARIDAHQLRSAPLRFLQVTPAVQVRHHRVAAPDQDQLRIDHRLGVGTDGRADRRFPAQRAGRGADRAVEERCAQAMEEAPVQALALHQAHGAGIAVGQDGARIIGGNVAEPGGNGVERLVPRDALEAPLALAADTFHRMQQALVGIHAIEIVRDLGAQRAVGEGHVGRAADPHRAAVGHGDFHRAGVGTVVRAGGADHALRCNAHRSIPQMGSGWMPQRAATGAAVADQRRIGCGVAERGDGWVNST